MKEIKLKIADDVYKRLKSMMFAKGVSGNFAGIWDEFMKKLIESIENEEEEKVFEFNKNKKVEKNT